MSMSCRLCDACPVRKGLLSDEEVLAEIKTVRREVEGNRGR